MALRRPPTTFSDSIDASDLAANSVTASELADDAVDTAALADGAVDADRLATDAVTSAKIATGAVIADGIGAGAVVAAGLGDGAVVAAKLGAGAVTTVKMAIDTIEVKPHIKHGWLYPAMKDVGGTPRQTDGVTAVVASTVGPAGSTITSSLYGTVQSDGKMYYYTDIKGSKPIKDPRIGSHFGSQRYKTTSVQKLEQESATHGQNVYSIDGREWARFVGTTVYSAYDSYGHYVSTSATSSTDEFIEIVCYANGLNYLTDTWHQQRDFTWAINGGSPTTNDDFETTIATPLTGSPARYVGPFSVANVFNGQTLGINTIRLNKVASHYLNIGAFELIAHDKFTDATCDTTNTDATVTMDSTAKLSVGLSVTGTGVPAGASVASITNATTFELSANATATNANQTFTFGGNDISIPPQNVVSYGKRFAISATSLHYNPFAFKTDGSTAWASGAHNGTSWPVGTGSSHNIDTATSLGLSKWLHSSNYYKPYNGGRVVIWIDSAGNIKTSVTVMPPNARSVSAGNISNKANASVANDTYLPTFETGAVDDFPTTALGEVAKTFHIREFGNGSGNGNATYADPSTLVTDGGDDLAFVMDDGSTSFAGAEGGSANTLGGQPPTSGSGLYTSTNSMSMSVTFIGTGLSGGIDNTSATTRLSTITNVAQNLPYGSHILKLTRGTYPASTIHIDGVQVYSGSTPYTQIRELTFHQPKMPPIPENAVVIADYMLMADFVLQTAGTNGFISKGSRMLSGTRDVLYDGPALTFNPNERGFGPMGMSVYHNTAGSTANLARIPAFATNAAVIGYDWPTRSRTYKQNGVTVSTTNTGGGYGSIMRPASSTTLGQNNFEYSGAGTSSPHVHHWDIANPIHTSSHYQTFETPFLHELVGGDRNMEQNNLVVTADGKTWDEVTRDTSYMGFSTQLSCTMDNGHVSSGSYVIFDEFRGINSTRPSFNKNVAIASDKMIILEEGLYQVDLNYYNNTPDSTVYITKNTATAGHTNGLLIRVDPSDCTYLGRIIWEMKRGDYIFVKVEAGGTNTFHGTASGYQQYNITKLN